MTLYKRLQLVLLCCILVVSFATPVFADSSSVWQETRTITLIKQQEKPIETPVTNETTPTDTPTTPTVQENTDDPQAKPAAPETKLVNVPTDYEVDIVWTNLSDPNISVEPIFAGGGIGTVDHLNSIIDGENNAKTKAIAGINGGYFDVYIDQQTYGSYLENGDVRHLGDIGSVLTFDGTQQFDTMPLYIAIEGSINGQWDEPNNWNAWNINHFMDQQDAVLLFDKNYIGQKPAHDYTGIVVIDGVVRKIEKGIFEIPTNGFLILAKNPSFINKFKLGYHADYRFNFYENTYDGNATNTPKIDVSNIKSALGAGPILIKNGQIVADPVKEGFFESKINYTKAKRSFVGVNANNQLAMGVVWDVTMLDLAEICQKLGLVNAINLDGGGSSGLYYNGSYIDTPSRKVANALVVKHHQDTAMRLIVNGKEVFGETRVPAIQKDGKTFILMSSFVKGAGGRYAYSPINKTAEMTRYEKRFNFNIEEGIITDGEQTASAEFIASDSKLDFYFELEAVNQLLGFSHYYRDEENKVIIQIETLETQLTSAKNLTNQGNYNEAINVFERAKRKDSKNIGITTSIADIYFNHLKDYENAKLHYKQALELSPNDASVKTRLGLTYLELGDTKQALSEFESSITLNPDYALAYYGVGLVKSKQSHPDVNVAKSYFKKAVELGIDGDPLNTINSYLNTN